MTAPPGTRLAGFQIGAEIGRGAMGVVYVAEDAEGTRVALKLLAPELARDDRFRKRFLLEAKVAATLEHPNVVRTRASGDEGGILYLALDYVDGCDLRELLRRDRVLEPARALAIVAQAAAALDAAHEAGLVHRDVKPSNILVDGDTAYVCDFGLARHVSSVGSLTGDRGFVGTIDYVAPEQIAGRAVDGRADQYALACVLFECLAGARPYERESDLATVFAHLNEPPLRVDEHRADLPRALDDVFARALAKSPENRYASCGSFVAAARAALAGERRPRRARLAATAATVVAVAVVALAAAALVLHARGPSAAHAALVTQTSIEGVRLGMTIPQVKRLLGRPWRQDVFSAPGYPVVIFHQRQVSVYFDGRKPRAIIVTTWNPAARTSKGVGPCSSISKAKRALGQALRPSHWNTIHGKVFGYLVGPNLFLAMVGTPQKLTDRIGVVALYDGNGPHDDGTGVDVKSGTLPFAAFVALSETTCSS